MDENRHIGETKELIDIQAVDRLPRGVICDGGFKLTGTPLAFVGARNPGLLFCAHLDQAVPLNAPRLIGTGLVMAALRSGRRHVDTLAVDYDRPFRLGRMDLRLLPAGWGPGSAMLEIRVQGRTIVFCGGLRVSQPLSGEPSVNVHCDLLLLDAVSRPERTMAPRTVKKQFVRWVMEQQSAIAVAVVCDCRTALYDVVSILSELPVPVHAHRSAYEMLRDTGALVSGSGAILRQESLWPASGVVLFLRHAFQVSRFRTRADVRVCRAGAVGDDSDQFAFCAPESAREYVAFARRTGASAIMLGPGCSPDMVEAFARSSLPVHRCHQPVQLPLGL